MDHDGLNQRLSQITTLWTLVRRATPDSAGAAREAQQQLIERYAGAIKRYLLGALHHADTADELFQEFAYRFLKGGLGGADPERGRFRNYVKGVLYHLVADHHKRRQRQPVALTPDCPEPADDEETLSHLDRDFLNSWRDEILARAWSALEEVEKKSGQPYYTVLRFRVANAELPSPLMADQLGTQLGRKVTAVGVRQTLHRAREKFAELVLDEVIHSLDHPTADHLEQELIDLGLMSYCQPALQKRG